MHKLYSKVKYAFGTKLYSKVKCAFGTTLVIGYSDYHPMTNIGYSDYPIQNAVPALTAVVIAL